MTNIKVSKRRTNSHTVGIPEKENQTKGTKQILKTVIPENFLDS